jgi:hypothetical protein
MLIDGTRCWVNQHDQYHCEDGPAVEYANGIKEWWLNGRLHREDGPAMERADGEKRWYYKGIFAGAGGKPDPTLWERLTSFEINGGPLLNGCVVDLDGVENWYRDDQLHREDGPAICYGVRIKQWHLHGKYLGYGTRGFWALWDLLTDEQRGNPTLLRWMPR